MNIIYDEDSIWLTDTIVTELRNTGHTEASYYVETSLRDSENELLIAITDCRRLLDAGNVQEAIHIAFYSPSSPDNINEEGRILMRILHDHPSKLSDIRSVIENSLNIIEQTEHVAKVPLNVMAALNVLFHLIVMRRRNFKASSEIFREVLHTELHIVDDLGETIYGPSDLELMQSHEQAFWNLLDVVIKKWKLEDLSTTQSPSLDIDLNMRTIASRTLFHFRSERIAA